MIAPLRIVPTLLSRRIPGPVCRAYSTATSYSDRVPTNDPNPPKPAQNVSETNATPMEEWKRDADMVESTEDAEKQRTMQAPNRAKVWSRSQAPRELAMSGPRFEQTVMEYQPQPLAAIDLIHKQPVRWTDSKIVSCDGGGGPLGHPKIFINVDKPQINWCTYCGLPFAHNHHRKFLESLPRTEYPLIPTSDPAEVNEQQRVQPNDPLGQR